MLCSIADRIQLRGLSPEQALADTVCSLANLIQSSRSLEIEREVGLFGELIVLLGLARTIGSKEALAAWLGPQREEHDFALRGLNIEVKTTRSERRIHWIESLTQLRPTGPRPLWLASCQITSAGPGAGNRLPDLVRLVRAGARDDEDRAALEERLQHAGWRDRFERTCQGPWMLRTKPAVFAVAGDFPRLTPDEICGVSTRDHIVQVRYQIDLTGRSPSAPLPEFLADSLEGLDNV
nr:PD-(D/E)XK motif protein [Streptomyces sp. SID8367]